MSIYNSNKVVIRIWIRIYLNYNLIIFIFYNRLVMRVLFDHQVFSLEVMGGMSKYYCELMHGLKKLGHEVVVPVWRTNNGYLIEAEKSESTLKTKKGRYYTWLKNWAFKWKNNLIFWYNKYRFLMNYEKLLNWVDLVHITLFDPYMIDILKKKNIPFVFNVYDLNHKTQNLKKTGLKWLFDFKMCDYADKGIAHLGYWAQSIICVSQQTKKDLLRYYPAIDEKKIQIIYHSIDNSQLQILNYQWLKWDMAIENWKSRIGNYILYIWKRKAEYKNFKPFVRAIAPSLSDDLKLVCLGHEGFDDEEFKLFEELWVSDYVIQMWGDESVKFDLLKNASCFVYPSLAEWFGIPILEARAGWCPVLCSNISVFIEIGAWAALYFDPKNIENMRELIEAVVKNSEIQNNLKMLWSQRVKLFSKEVELEKTVDVYEKVIDGFKNLQS